MEKQLTELGNKIKTLLFRVNKTEDIITKRDRQALERQDGSIASIVETVNALKETIEEKKFGKGESEEEIAEWSEDIDKQLEEADEASRKINRLIKIIDQQEQEVELAEKT